ncbi:MAG TPA: cytochrome c peroxidase [Bryobacteraceae bacterium]|nr:cytochrome c peroxidase [Bryobacteraceae bacterium]
MSCRKDAVVREAIVRPAGNPIKIEVPLGLPPVPIPSDDPPTAETIALGRKLFYDGKLSKDNTISCASCHNPALAFSDPRRLSQGVGGKSGTRNAPAVLNAAYFTTQFWDGRAPSLEEQALAPMVNPVEMDQAHDISVQKIDANAIYRHEFEQAFGPGPVTITEITMALASFERTLLSGDSPFDRYEYGGEKNAMSPAAIRGLSVFRDKNKGNCAACHTIGAKYALFSDNKFHNLGVGLDDEGNIVDQGRYIVTRVTADQGCFRTPTLRDVALTAPYMHDGSEKTLKDVVDFYVGGGSSNPYLDKEIKPLNLTGQERSDLVAFLESLTGKMPQHSGPEALASR